MKSTERNAFEKELQKDPFAEEASEGFNLITPEEVSGDIADLQKQLKKRVGKTDRIIYYRIAASIAALMIVSSVLIIIGRKISPKQIAANMERTISPEITEVLPIPGPADKPEPSVQPAIVPKKKSVKSPNNKDKPEADGAVNRVENNMNVVYRHKDSISEIEAIPPEEELKPEQIEAVSLAAAGSKRSEQSEVTVAEYDAVKAVSVKEDRPSGYKPPQPSGGKSEFDKYVRKNLHRPDTLSSEQRVIVVLKFFVRTDGGIDSIRVVSSQGKAFADEAIRLLRSGPAWQPAEQNGKPVEDQVRVRIVFK
jgi:outer membrane biosynthesis protein TonB